MTTSRTGKTTTRRLAAGRVRGGVRSFTLIEILLVIAVLVMLAGLIWPNVMGRREQARFDHVVLRVSTMMSLARSGAMMSGRTHRCVFDEGGGRMRVEWEPEPFDGAGEFEPVEGSWARLDLAKEGVRCEMVDLSGVFKAIRVRERDVVGEDPPAALLEPVTFRPDGRCDSGVIVLKSKGGREAQMAINGLTGQVRMVESWQGERQE